MQSPSKTISYNIAVKHKDSASYIVSPSADIISGTRDIIGLGNNYLDTSFYVDIAAYSFNDTLEVQLQSIDNGFQTSSFTKAIPIINCNGSSTSYTSLSHCLGDSSLWEGNYYSSVGVYSTTYPNVQGCDSVLILNLSVDSLADIIITSTIPDTIKLHDSPYHIPLVTPIGGMFLGNLVNGQLIDPSLGNIGVNYIYYAYTDSITGCNSVDSLMVFIIDDTGIEGVNDHVNKINLYPNPTESNIYLKLDQRPDKYIEIHLFNSSGKFLSSVKEPSELLYKISLKGMDDGLYFIKLYDSNGYLSSKKFIIIK
jgi:hypothetical protein